MRNILLILIFFSSFSFAQTGINYQGAATDSQGNKLENQNISLRTSVLQGGVDGTTSYSETHNTTTDQFGLFNVVIGQGEVVSGDFEGISWGADAHFLKVELDATGGTNYSLVSTTQMMSVPYALYAENSGLDSAAIASLIYTSQGSYEWSELHNSIITNGYYGFPDEILNYKTNKDGFIYFSSRTVDGYQSHLNLIINSDNLSTENKLVHSLSNNQHGYLLTIPVKENDSIFITGNIATNEEIDLKVYFISSNSTNTAIDSAMVADMIANSEVSTTSKNYKFPLGLSNEFISSGIYETNNTNYTNYLVPDNKILFITQLYLHNTMEFKINEIILADGNFNSTHGSSLNLPILVDENQLINSGDYEYSNTGGGVFNGFLINKSNIQPITHALNYQEYINDNYQQLGSDYTVPDSKLLVITQVFNDISINGEIIGEQLNRSGNYNMVKLESPLLMKSGDIISSTNQSGGKNAFNGYLVDEDYFESPSSSSSSNSGGGGNSDMQMTVSTFGDTLTIGDQSVIIPGISYENTPESIFGSVTDINGNIYQTVKIYNQEWMTEDLNTNTFSNGESITQFAWWDNNNNEESAFRNNGPAIYYNGYAVIDARNICPSGWHVPTIAEFTEMLNYFGIYDGIESWTDAGKALKSTDPNFWEYYYLNNNSSFLNVLNNGWLQSQNSGTIDYDEAHFYTYDANGSGHGIIRLTDTSNNVDVINKNNYPSLDFHKIRCVKD